MTRLLSPWRSFAAVGGLCLLAACTSFSAPPSQTSASHYSASGNNSSFRTVQTSAGQVLTTSNGMTLYVYDRDDRGRSNCYGECAQHWPPYMANNDSNNNSQPSGNLTLVPRADGKMQWAVNGKPLYTFVQDDNPGDVSGHNVHNDWHVVTYMM